MATGRDAGSVWEQDLAPNPANYVPLTPISFLRRAASVYPDKVAVIHGRRRITYGAFAERCRRFASALAARGVGKGDTVALLAPNIPAMLEAHYAVPMLGAVLNSINIRLDADTVGFILDHGGAKILIADCEFAEVTEKALAACASKPLLVEIDDSEADYAASGGGRRLGTLEYEAFLAEGDPGFEGRWPDNEWEAIALNYTSGTTGNPKGVVYHHRGAYLNAIGDIVSTGINAHCVYLWTLPMFHCNGWCFTWAVTAACGTHVCLRRVEAATVYRLIKQHGVTILCGAPIVLNLLANAPDSAKVKFERVIEVITGGAAPPSAIIEAMDRNGFHVTHLYGLTETYGPATICAPQESWDQLDLEGRARAISRQGVPDATLEAILVADPETMEPVLQDGMTIGELMLRGNTVMKGYLKNAKATQDAFRGGWFHSGDLAVWHPDGYAEIKDRAKDIIISGGENISSLEVEEVLYRHPKVLEAAVVARPDEKWGETPCAFVTLREGAEPDERDIINWCRTHMASFKIPRTVRFGPLPKTSTGKIQKYILRERAKELGG
ncbi:acyl-CoA synthetase [Hypericibacter sp.]|uniref:acyl-CoA synthetase n=1 Tax=Hypericibacter sp. TaxID=2705401 RepID=UPI003D6CFE3E